MLPDLPILKKELWEIWSMYLQRQIHANMGVFQEVGRYTSHEGDRLRVFRADGSVEDSDFQRASSEMTMKLSDIPTATVLHRLQMLDMLAKEMGTQMATHLFQSLDKTLTDAGQVINGQGKSFDHETIFAVMESVHIDFDESGRHSPLSLVHAPGMADDVRKAFRTIENDPQIKARYEDLIARKKVEWRDREAARKLVG